MGKWEMVRLGDFLKIASGGTPLKNRLDYYDKGTIPWVKTGDLKEKYIDSDSVERITNLGLANSSAKLFPTGTVLVAMYGATIGATSILNFEACTNQACAAFLPSQSIQSEFLYYFLLSQKANFIKLGVGGAQPNISATILKKVKIPLPPVEEQKRIAKSLDLASEIFKGYKEQLAELDKLVQSVFYEMFGDPVTNEKVWRIENLGNLCDISRGGSPRPIEMFIGGSIPWIKIGDATNGDNIYLNSTKEHIIEDGVKKSRLIKSGGLIFANCGVSLGFARIITFDGCIHDGWLAFENISQKLNVIFLLKSLNFCTNYFRRTAPDGTQPNLNTGIMKNFHQIVPPLHLQTRFASIVTEIEAQKAQVQQALTEAENLFNSLMQEYFE